MEDYSTVIDEFAPLSLLHHGKWNTSALSVCGWNGCVFPQRHPLAQITDAQSGLWRLDVIVGKPG